MVSDQPNANETILGASGAIESRPTRFIRDLFTGELREVVSDGGGRRIIFRGSVPKHYDPTPAHVNPWGRGKDHINRPLSIKDEEATPERIERENEDARRHGTGARYDAAGNCHVPTRGSLARECRRTHRQDNDAGYSDYPGR